MKVELLDGKTVDEVTQVTVCLSLCLYLPTSDTIGVCTSLYVSMPV